MSFGADPGDEIWRVQVGPTSNYELANAVAADADGNFYLAGGTRGSVDGETLNAGGYDFAVYKISSVNGSVLWSWQDGAVGDDALSGAAVTNDGGVVVAGYSNGTYNGVSEGLTDFVAIKLDADGAVEWTWQEGTAQEDSINSCSRVADGNVVVSGATFGGWQGAAAGNLSIAAVKLDVTDGTVIWWYSADIAPNGVASYESTPRADGSIVLAGITDGNWDRPPVGVNDIAAVALDEDGAELWRYQGGASGGYSQANDAAALADGSVVLAGQTSGALNETTPNNGGLDFAVIKLTAAGVEEWSWQGGSASDDSFSAAVAGLDGTSVIFAGNTVGSWVGTMAGTEDDADFAGMSLDADRNLLWTYQAGTDQGDAFRGIAVRSTDGAALLAGWTNDNWVADGTVNLYSEIAGVLIETGALAPTPVPATLVPSVSPTSAPVAVGSSPSPATFAPVSRSGPSCGATEPFQVTSVDLPVVEGCYQATEASYSTGGAYEVWSVSGTLELGEVIVVGFTDDGTGEFDDFPWTLSFVPEDGDATGYCLSEELSATVHPADATWSCDLDGTGAYVPVTDTFFFFVCGCTSSPPSPTPSPILAPTSAPSPESGGGSGNEMVIGGSVGGVVALLAIIVGVFVWRRRQARGDSNFGGSPPAPASFPVASGGVGRSGGNGAAPPLPPPPAYSEPPPPKVDVGAPPAGDLLPPPPAYSELPPYSG